MRPIESHKDLMVWQKAVTLAGRVYAVTRSFPHAERYGLQSQLRRCAVSIPSNIAEGSARRSRGEFLQFLHIARGSLSELETQLMIARDQALLTGNDSALADVSEVGRLLNGLIRSLQSSPRDSHARACDQFRSACSDQPPTANR